MYSVKNKNMKITLTLLAAVTAGIILSRLFTSGDTVYSVDYITADASSLLPRLRTSLIPLCLSQMLQFFIIFVFAFSAFAKTANIIVFTFRGMALGCSSAIVLSSAGFSLPAMCFIISYALTTLVMMIFRIYLSDSKIKIRLSKDRKEKLTSVFECVILFLMTSGASVLIKTAALLLIDTVLK